MQKAVQMFSSFFLTQLKLADTQNTDELAKYKYDEKIAYQLQLALDLFPDIYSASYIDLTGRIYSTDAALHNHNIPLNSAFYQELSQKPIGTNTWFPMQNTSFNG